MGKMEPMEQVDIKSSDFWIKILENHQKNWAVVEPAESNAVTVFFVNDLSGVFDHE